MKKRNIALLLLVCLLTWLFCPAATAGETASLEELMAIVQDALPTFAEEDVVATVDGQAVTWGEVKAEYLETIAYYGEFQPVALQEELCIAMDSVVKRVSVAHIAARYGLDQYTQEELDALAAAAAETWQASLEDYIGQVQQRNGTVGAQATQADWEAAEAFYASRGYSYESMLQDRVDSDLAERVAALAAQEVVVSDVVKDIELIARYNELIPLHREVYGNNPIAYEWAVQDYVGQEITQLSVYHPAGYRYIKQIFLWPDDEIMEAYRKLTIQVEQQEDLRKYANPANGTAEEGDPMAYDPALEQELQAQLDAMGAEIMASMQEELTEITGLIADGADFDQLIQTYSQDAYTTTGEYVDWFHTGIPGCMEVCSVSMLFSPTFVEAAMALETIGDSTEPILDTEGVHIIQYVGDRLEGPLPMNDFIRGSIEKTIVAERQVEAEAAWWAAAADVAYTGLLPAPDMREGV